MLVIIGRSSRACVAESSNSWPMMKKAAYRSKKLSTHKHYQSWRINNRRAADCVTAVIPLTGSSSQRAGGAHLYIEQSVRMAQSCINNRRKIAALVYWHQKQTDRFPLYLCRQGIASIGVTTAAWRNLRSIMATRQAIAAGWWHAKLIMRLTEMPSAINGAIERRRSSDAANHQCQPCNGGGRRATSGARAPSNLVNVE